MERAADEVTDGGAWGGRTSWTDQAFRTKGRAYCAEEYPADILAKLANGQSLTKADRGDQGDPRTRSRASTRVRPLPQYLEDSSCIMRAARKAARR